MGSSTSAAIAIVVVTVIVLGAVGLRPMTTETRGAGLEPPGPIDRDAPAWVRGNSESSGIQLMGVVLRDSDRLLRVEARVPRPCLDAIAASGGLDGDWPPAIPECDVDLPLEGRISGGGIDAQGEATVIVEFSASRDCFAEANPGSAWPTGLAACDAEEGR